MAQDHPCLGKVGMFLDFLNQFHQIHLVVSFLTSFLLLLPCTLDPLLLDCRARLCHVAPMRRRKGSSAPRRLGEILPETLKKKALYLPTKDRPLIDAWNQAVGPQIGSKAQPDRLKDDVLYVRVSTSVWMHELQFMKQDIIAKLNGIIGGNPVTQIRFFIGEIEAAPAKLDERALLVDARDLKPAEKDFITSTISEVTDPELREVLEKAMTRSIQRGLKDS
jgi:hypothetical protein